MMLGASSFAALALAGCATTVPQPPVAPRTPAIPAENLAIYAALPNERFHVPAADIHLIDPIYWRQEVANTTGEKAGTVLVDTPNRFLFWTMPDGRAMRYGVGIGRDGFADPPAWGRRSR